MVHYENEINQSLGHSILECLDTIENVIHPSLVPVWENKRLHTNLVDFKSLCEYTIKSNASTLNEAIENIKSFNHTDSLCICIDEAYIYDNPHIVDLLPVSKDSIEYKLAEEYMTAYIETKDPEVLNEYNEITGLNLPTDILNEFLDPTTGKSLTAQDIKDQYGSFDAYKQQLQLSKDKGSTVTNFNAANKTKEQAKAFENAQKKQMQAYQQEQDRKQAKRDAIIATNVRASQAANPNQKSGGPSLGDSAIKAGMNMLGGNGENGQPGWWARNFAAFKNWMNNTFGTNFNTRIGGYDTYDKFKSGAKEFAGNVMQDQLSNKNSALRTKAGEYYNKAQGWVKKNGPEWASDLLDTGKDFVKGFIQPANAATEITAGQILSEVYRPRRMYRSTYMRMH